MPKTYCRRKAVQITVYVVKPRRTKYASNNERRSGHRHPALHNSGGGYDRKAQLLSYTRQLRTVACRQQASLQKPQTLQKVKQVVQIVSNQKPQNRVKEVLQITARQKPQHKVSDSLLQIKEVHQINRTTSLKVVPVEHKPAHAKLPRPPPSCFGDWKNILLPGFLGRNFGNKRVKNDTNKKKKKLSVSISEKMNAIMMSSRMEKERIGIMAKFLSAIEKHR